MKKIIAYISIVLTIVSITAFTFVESNSHENVPKNDRKIDVVTSNLASDRIEADMR
ncbi:hypothetical protein [Marinigracilibium pacificum]|uniref:Uncharacterized protein n=1 Tax=Marinigracilibium pacificum TaxID=2729599 RepID=A0A848J6X2_9BACT|nr:hypothetical protein [Marinigracilibium pacificum]NMM50260.1 hypothetical protein [Marinigracilibium pacificum]